MIDPTYCKTCAKEKEGSDCPWENLSNYDYWSLYKINIQPPPPVCFEEIKGKE